MLLPQSMAQAQTLTCANTVTVQSGDTLSSIAEQYLDNGGNYDLIIQSTNAKAATDSSYASIGDANQLAVGMKLCISRSSTSSTSSAAPAATARPAAATAATSVPTVAPTPASRVNVPNTDVLAISWGRAQKYPGSAINIEQTLAPGANYNRYYASYDSEGLKQYGLLTVPRGEKPATGWPVIVFNHGFIPPDVYKTTERYIAYVDNLARSGYIVFRIDYRGHDASEGQASGAYGAPDYTFDVLNAVASIKAYPDADPNRIGMWGHSMGGYLTLRSMVINKDIKVGVIWAGVVASYPDMLNRWRRANSQQLPAGVPTSGRRWRQQLVEDYGTPEENPTFWNSISANSFLADVSGPIQLHHGSADADVPLEFSETLDAQLKAAGKTVELYTYQGDNHNISVNFSAAMRRTIAFFDGYLK